MSELTLHGHSLRICPPGERKDDRFCTECHDWFLPVDWTPKGSPMSELEKGLLAKLQKQVSFGLNCNASRFIRGVGYTGYLTGKQRGYMASLAYHYRRQYTATEEELAWIAQLRLDKERAP